MTERYALPRDLAGQTHRPPPVRLYVPPASPVSRTPPLTIYPSPPQPAGEIADRAVVDRSPARFPVQHGGTEDPDRAFLFLLIGLLLLNDASPELILALCYAAM